jgi:peptidoglycan DL-endopeptidase CwlO
MSTIKQGLKVISKSSKAVIRSKRRLLLAAVILFSLILFFIAPLSIPEHLLFSVINHRQPIAIKEITNNPDLESSAYQRSHLANNNVLASINLESDTKTDESSSDNSQDIKLALLRETALITSNNPVTFISQGQNTREEITQYTVQEGDVPSTIAASLGISLNTLLWANDLRETSIIRPGDELVVLPVTGVLHRVKSGQTIGWIADHYEADEEDIIAFNDLPTDGTIQIGEKIIIPDGQMPVSSTIAVTASRSIYSGQTRSGNYFPYGQCTWYVAQKRNVPWSGHARSWLANARAYGYSTGSVPQAGAIISINESWYGHVAYVEAVSGNWVTFSEMNYLGLGIKSVRTLHINSSKIQGYIY